MPRSNEKVATTVHRYKLEDIFLWIVRNAFLLILALLAGMALGYLVNEAMPTTYQSKSRFLVEELPFGPGGSKRESTDAETERALVQTFIQGVPSREMRQAVAKRLGITPSQISFVDVERPLSLGSSQKRANIRVESARNSRIGTVVVNSQDPTFAAEVANAVLDELLSYNMIGGKLKYLKSALEFAKNRADSLVKPLLELSQERVRLERENAELAAFVKQGFPLHSYPAFANDATLNNLKTQLMLIQSQYDSIAASATRGPQLEGKRSELNALRQQINRHAQSLAAALKTQLEIIETQENNVRKEQQAAQEEIQRIEALSARLIGGFGNLSALPSLMQGDLGAIPDNSSNVIVIIDKASPQNRPVSPKLWLNLFLGGFFGMAIGVGIAVVRTQLDKKLVSLESVERLTGLPCLALLPLPNTPKKIATRNSLGISFLRSRLLGEKSDRGQIIGFTPAKSNQDSSRLVADLAILLAQAEKRTLIVDLHFTAPRQAQLLGIDDCRGLNEWLVSDHPLADYINYSTICELAVLHPGKVNTEIDDLLSRRSFPNELSKLLDKWDFILIDSPCILTDWSLLLSLPAHSPLIITANYKVTTSVHVSRCASHARRPQWDIWGVVLCNCPGKVLKKLQA